MNEPFISKPHKILFEMDPALYLRLTSFCKEEGRTKKWVINKAIGEYLDREEESSR